MIEAARLKARASIALALDCFAAATAAAHGLTLLTGDPTCWSSSTHRAGLKTCVQPDPTTPLILARRQACGAGCWLTDEARWIGSVT